MTILRSSVISRAHQPPCVASFPNYNKIFYKLKYSKRLLTGRIHRWRRCELGSIPADTQWVQAGDVEQITKSITHEGFLSSVG